MVKNIKILFRISWLSTGSICGFYFWIRTDSLCLFYIFKGIPLTEVVCILTDEDKISLEMMAP